MNSRDWKKLPGGFDTLHSRILYETTNEYDIPDLLPQPEDFWPPSDLYAYRYRQKIRTDRPVLIHFHTDDYRFENVWNEPSRGINSVDRAPVWAACTPDFSLWYEYPYAMQLWNTYRNRWTGRHWQERGALVIPSVNWSTPDTYDFAFAGIPQNQIITLRSYALRTELEHELHTMGYQEMIQRLQPRCILWFGQDSTVIHDHIPKLVFNVGWIPNRKGGESKWAEAEAEAEVEAEAEGAEAEGAEAEGAEETNKMMQ